MLGLPRNRFAIVAAVLSVLVLSSCSNDPIVSAVRPTKEDMAAQPKPAPAGSMPALMRMGEATRQAGDLVNALGYFRRAHQVDIFAPAPLVKIGVTLNDLGQYNEAAEVFKDAVAVDHNNTDALRGLGTALIGLNQPALAVDNLNAALAIEPDYRTYNALGVAHDHLGDHMAAQKYYNEGLRIFPNNLTLLNNLGLSQILSGDLEEAGDTLVAAAQLPGAGPRQRQNLALAYGLAGREQEAARVLRLDLDNRAIQSNLAYYGILRAADDAALMAAVMGVHVPVNASAPPPVQSGQLPADPTDTEMQPADGPAEDVPSINIIPEAGPGAGQPAAGAAPKPGAQVSPPQPSSRVIALQTRPSGGAYRSKQIRDFSEAATIETQELAELKPASAPEPATAETAAPEADTDAVFSSNTAQPTAAATETTGQEPVPPAVVAAAETQPQAAEAVSPQAAPAGETRSTHNEPTAGAAPTERAQIPPPVTTGYSDLAPAASPKAAVAAPVAQNFPTPDSHGAPIWYAEPRTAEPAVSGDHFIESIVDFLFGPSQPKAPERAAAAPATAAASSELAAIQPAAPAPLLGASAASDSAFESNRNLTMRYLQRLDSVRAADPPPNTGLPANAAP